MKSARRARLPIPFGRMTAEVFRITLPLHLHGSAILGVYILALLRMRKIVAGNGSDLTISDTRGRRLNLDFERNRWIYVSIVASLLFAGLVMLPLVVVRIPQVSSPFDVFALVAGIHVLGFIFLLLQVLLMLSFRKNWLLV